MENRIIVFSSHSIYMEGVVNRLREFPQIGELRFVDSAAEDFVQQVVALDPAIVIVDSVTDGTQCCLLCELLNSFAALNIVRLRIQDKDVQVISSSSHHVENAQNLIDLISNIDP